MKRPLVLLLVLLSCREAARGDDRWHRSLEQALSEAQKSQKPIFLVFRCER